MKIKFFYRLLLLYMCVLSPLLADDSCTQILEEQQRLRLENENLQKQSRETLKQVQILQKQLKKLTQLQIQWLNHWQLTQQP